MKTQDRLAAFVRLQKVLDEFLATNKGAYSLLLKNAMEAAHANNPWFTQESIRNALQGIVLLLEEEKLRSWLAKYPLTRASKKVACILAGNIPMVGFHDMLCVVLSGHQFVGKCSRKDKYLMTALAQILQEIAPEFRNNIVFLDNLRDTDYDAVIATGSNNSARYFQQYFGQKPHIIRKGRSSVAILSGKETEKQFEGLADDVFMYFGLGCRNVSKIYIPKDFDIRKAFPAFAAGYSHYQNHHKWMNNYSYNRSINLLNQEKFYETQFALFQEHEALVSPLAVVYYETYETLSQLHHFLQTRSEELQCIVSDVEGKDFVPLGKAQFPEIDTYADGIDTMAFLQQI